MIRCICTEEIFLKEKFSYEQFKKKIFNKIKGEYMGGRAPQGGIILNTAQAELRHAEKENWDRRDRMWAEGLER